jgi:hypothetical protein
MTARQQRRQEERKAHKAALKNGKLTEATAATPEATAACSSSSTYTAMNRAEVNRKNAQHSTGPRTAEGKAASSQNAFKHGLYSKQLVLPGEDPAELDALRADLRGEHQPASTTEEILVNELAEHYWRLRRMRKFEARAMSADNFETGLAILPIIQRTMASAERGFHKALKTLTDLQRQRGFVPQTQPTEAQPTAEPAQSESCPQPVSEQTSPETHSETFELPLDTPQPRYQSAA